MARNKKEECPPPGAPGWMTTYGDCMTLLLTFFVLLLSFSSIRDAKFRRAIGALKGALGVLPYEQSVIKPKEMPIPQLSNLMESEVQESLAELNETMNEMGMSSDIVKLQLTEAGIKIRLSDTLLFDVGRAHIKPQIYPILQVIVGLTEGWPNKIIVEGHTDDRPIHTEEFASNWELSAQRAINVVKYFEELGVDSKKLYPVGRGANDPIVPNDTEVNRALNRRIEIYVEYDPNQVPLETIQKVKRRSVKEE
ncbi:hypothetical protein DRQ09_01265 [candidate division KSB1 bacterium]|nr:MAG: hypothetical protein DRQ09_01265 [candidate division KSB1 bacterium]